MRAAVRAWVVDLAGRAGAGAVRVTPRALIAGLCASALAPLAVTGLEAATIAAVAGSVGANMLTDVIGRALESARRRAGGTAPPAEPELRAELARRLEERLAADDDQARMLAAQLERMLRDIGAAQVMVDAAVQHGNRELLEYLGTRLSGLNGTLSAFASLAHGLDTAMISLQRILRRQDAEHRHDRELVRRQLALLTGMRMRLELLEYRTRPAAAHGPGQDPAPWAQGCPYLGLMTYQAEHERVFFGRSAETGRLLGLIAEQLEEGGLVLVTGASGAGKSSLLRAGVLPALAHGLLPGAPESRYWPHLVLTPTAQPLHELSVWLAARCRADPDAVEAGLRADPGNVRRRIRDVLVAQAAHNPMGGGGEPVRQRLVLVIDQLEEIFTYPTTAGGPATADVPKAPTGPGKAAVPEREAFLAALRAAATPDDAGGAAPAVVVAVVRGDFVDRCAAHPVLARALNESCFVLGPMRAEELREVICGPAAAAGVAVEQNLPETVLADLVAAEAAGLEPGGFDGQRAYGAGALPLLSEAMARTWRHRHLGGPAPTGSEPDPGGGRLTIAGYAAAGKVATAVRDSAEEAYAVLDERRRRLAKALLLQLVITQPDGRHGRRRLARTDLTVPRHGIGDPAGQCPDGQDAAQEALAEVVEVFTARRLLVADEQTVELSHEVLLTAWPRLRGWLAEGQADRVLYGQVLEDAAEWRANARDEAYLYQGSRLAAVEQALPAWQATTSALAATPPAVMLEFLDASRRAATRTARRRRLVLNGLVAALVVTIVAAGAALIALRAQREATQQRDAAISRKVAREAIGLRDTDSALAAQLAIAAYRLAPTAEARGAVLGALAVPYATRMTGPTAIAAAFHQNGRLLVTVGADAIVRQWDAADPNRPRSAGRLPGHRGEVLTAAFSPDGTALATAGDDHAIRIWDVRTPLRFRPRATLMGHTDTVRAITFSPDGRSLATSADGATRVWDLTDRHAPMVIATGLVMSAAFHPSGRLLATGHADAEIRLWDLASGRKPKQLRTEMAHTDRVLSVAFSPDGRILASGGFDNALRLWDVSDPRHAAFISASEVPSSMITTIAFSPDGHTIATGDYDATIHLSDITDPKFVGAPVPLTGHIDTVTSVTFSPDGGSLLSTSRDSTTRLWHTRLGLLTGHSGEVNALAVSPDERILVTGSYQTGRVWVIGSPAGPTPLTTLSGHTDNITAMAYGIGGLLATASLDRTVRLWDLNDPAHPRTLTVLAHDASVTGLALSPQGVLATCDSDGTIRLWDVRVTVALRLLAKWKPVNDPLNTVAFSKDGLRLAGGGEDGVVRLWDVRDPSRPIAMAKSAAHPDGVTALNFSAGTGILASAGGDGTIRLWDGGAHLATLTGHVMTVTAVAFDTRGGHTLASAGRDGTVRLWDVADPRNSGQATTLISNEHRMLSLAFASDNHRLITGGADGTARLFDTDVERAAARICALPHPELSRAQWDEYFPGLAIRRPCDR
ncbi:AAA family ATPase [Spongiactinospora sp. 9N601]|uniref:nSTAND1 domain-containing NTPase n=1 Tax=Spongiactinospora sp. 9N601 TaxID=3375149 RepID=UPI0037B8D874